MEVSKEILDDIAQSLELGFKCFIHRKTFEVVAYLDPEEHLELEPEDWEEDINKIENDKENFIELEGMEPNQSFKVMVAFTHSLEDSPAKIRLITALEGQKPFANFKHQIHNMGEERELWFAFKSDSNIDWIKRQLSIH